MTAEEKQTDQINFHLKRKIQLTASIKLNKNSNLGLFSINTVKTFGRQVSYMLLVVYGSNIQKKKIKVKNYIKDL